MSRKTQSSPSALGKLITQAFREAAQQAAARAEAAKVAEIEAKASTFPS
jgi:hypothetical protein